MRLCVCQSYNSRYCQVAEEYGVSSCFRTNAGIKESGCAVHQLSYSCSGVGLSYD